MNLSGEYLFRALSYIGSLSVGSRQFEVGEALLNAPIARWPRMLTYLRLAYGSDTPEYATATVIEQILRGMEVAAA